MEAQYIAPCTVYCTVLLKLSKIIIFIMSAHKNLKSNLEVHTTLGGTATTYFINAGTFIFERKY